MDLDQVALLVGQSLLAPSITIYCMIVFVGLQSVLPRYRNDIALAQQSRLALLYASLGGLILICALFDFDVAGSMRGTQSAVAPIAVLLAISGVALTQRWYLVAVWLLLVLTGFLLKLTAAENIWLYLFDPIALAIAAVFSWRHRYRLRGFAFRPQLIQRSTIVFIAVFLIYAVWLSRSSPDEFRYALVVEDGLVEWTTVIVLLLTMIVCFRRVMLLRRRRSRLFLFVTAMLGLFCLFGAGEEISWGQRMLGLESPDFFEENNAQGEIGFHNLVVEIDGERVKLNKLIFGTGLAFAMLIYLFVATPLYRKNAEARRFFDAIAAPMPQNYQVVGYLVVIATVELLIDHSKRGEMTEFAGAIIFTLNVVYPANQSLFKAGEAGEPLR